ncbi:MAG TPA: diaminopimelate epimerase [Candidatus Acidoferrum sp.]|nr:diaminopimelate epimerase [Candidatus Acidoferrum sp.]
MQLRFTKMHGLGNDFMVLDLVNQQVELSREQVCAWSHRKMGIGFDQLLIVEPATRSDCDFGYRIYNADGDIVEHCGNGARCITRFIVDKGLSTKRDYTFEMARGTIATQLQTDGQVTVDMRPPILVPAQIPFVADRQAVTYPLTVDGNTYQISAVSMGNPHSVMVVDDVEHFPVLELGPKIEHHPAFPQRVNAGFMQVVNRREINLRVYERGAGETLACGTGACGAVVAGRLRGLLDNDVVVHTHGGDMRIRWDGDNASVWKTGPAVTVFEGTTAL